VITSQLSEDKKLRHLLSISGLEKTHILDILDTAQTFFLPNSDNLSIKDNLKNITVANLFFEPSTRTRSTFELAAKRLSANVLNLPISESATSKGESLRDTVLNLQAMQCELFVIRHHQSGAAQFVANHLNKKSAVINAGDGWHAHPTQALLDMFTLRKHHKKFPRLKVAIVGDILHSRVARSQIQAMQKLGFVEIRVIAPNTLLPQLVSKLGVKTFTKLEEGIEGVDVIMMLRLQKERMHQALLPTGNSYFSLYGLTEENLKYADKDAIIIHPGPINRGVEIESELADSPRAVILNQVTNGVAIRMAVMTRLAEQFGGA
jgi:aspartate carbamoyltransferase catalytic subunit